MGCSGTILFAGHQTGDIAQLLGGKSVYISVARKVPWFIPAPPENSSSLLNLCYLTSHSRLNGFSSCYNDAGYCIGLPLIVVNLPKAREFRVISKTPHRGFIPRR